MRTRRYLEIDVFGARPLYGNPLAVVVDSDGLDAAAMQRIAAWTNFSETTFLMPPTHARADYRVRIFTPRQELPFAGHPSVGSAHAAIECGRVGRDRATLVQECAAGLLAVEVDGAGRDRTIRVQAPPARVRELDAATAAALQRALGTTLQQPPADVCNGPHWLVCDLGEAATVRTLQPDMTALGALCLDRGAVGACVFGRERDGDAAMAVRAFCPADGIPEDPVTGSANAAIAACLHVRDGLQAYGRDYLASQGREVGRDGYVTVRVDAGGEVRIGGRCATLVEGTLRL